MYESAESKPYELLDCLAWLSIPLQNKRANQKQGHVLERMAELLTLLKT